MKQRNLRVKIREFSKETERETMMNEYLEMCIPKYPTKAYSGAWILKALKIVKRAES